jgi:hypothetical protein
MDPVTGLGAVTAGLQLTGAAAQGLLATIRILKDQKDVPERTAQLLKDIDRDVASINDLLRPGTPQFNMISAEHYAQFSSSAVEARKAMDELRQVVQPLVISEQDTGRGKGKFVARLWKAVVSLKTEKEVETKLARVQRLNARLLQDLNTAMLGAQATLAYVFDFVIYSSELFRVGSLS